ncbi:MAG TPA: nuclear transport factor 2 family protein [Anaerolineae bacterium]|nr:nuclear transport factor 2 family protein [Anaerolineae bacterium]HPL26438.1 nuclear transport factor 2 family protein [Anaerolineae bacterium]
MDAANVLEAFDAALSAHDPEAALALLAEDAEVRYEPPPPPPGRAVYRGRAEIRSLIVGLVAQGVKVQAEGYRAEGERALSQGRRVYAAGHEALGGNPVALEGEALVRRGRIVALTFTFGPESLARIRAAVAARQQG